MSDIVKLNNNGYIKFTVRGIEKQKINVEINKTDRM